MTEPSQSKSELSDEFRKLGENLAESLKALWEHPETRQIRTEMKDVRSGEVETRARHELIHALNSINIELQKVKERLEQTDIQDGKPNA
jgi:hypothetical protein